MTDSDWFQKKLHSRKQLILISYWLKNKDLRLLMSKLSTNVSPALLGVQVSDFEARLS